MTNNLSVGEPLEDLESLWKQWQHMCDPHRSHPLSTANGAVETPARTAPHMGGRLPPMWRLGSHQVETYFIPTVRQYFHLVLHLYLCLITIDNKKMIIIFKKMFNIPKKNCFFIIQVLDRTKPIESNHNHSSWSTYSIKFCETEQSTFISVGHPGRIKPSQ